MLLNKPVIDFNALGALITATIIPVFELDEDSQNLVADELTWLFSAAENLMKICQKEVEPNQPVAVAIPSSAEKTSPEANNQLLAKPGALIRYSSFEDMLWGKRFNLKKELESIVNRFNIHMRGLNILLDRESKLGEAGASDLPLQAGIRGGRIDVIKVVQALAQIINDTYGIQITSPTNLLEYLGEA
jgi:hypothetical protein